MDIQAKKIALVKEILEIENLEKLNELSNLLKKDFWNELSLAQKEEIEKADLEILNEETTDYETFISPHRSSKLDFIKEFINLNDKETINKLENILWQKNDFWHELSPAQKNEINLGIKQLNEGKRYSYEAVLKEIS